MQLCFATGNLRQSIGKIDLVQTLSKLDIDGIEWTFGKEFGERPITDKDADFLRTFDFVSIHSPFRFSSYYLSAVELEKGKKTLEESSKLVRSKQVVIHPSQIFPSNFFANCSFQVITENLNPKKGKVRPRLGFEKTLKANSNWGLCLDVCHAFDWSEEETARIVSKWKHRIKQVHFSNNRYHKDHLPFEKVSRAFLKSIEPVLGLNVPFVIEEDMPYTSIKQIKEEIARVRKILSL